MNGWSCFPKHGPAHFTELKYFLSEWYEAFQKPSNHGCFVFPQIWPSFFHGVEELFRFDVMQPFKNIQVDGWAALSNIFCHGPAHFAALKNFVVLMLCRFSRTFK